MRKEINCVNCVKNKPDETWDTCKRKCSYKYKKREQDAEYQLKRAQQECEKLKAIITEAEEAPICFHCSEEPCIRQERDKYKQALDEIEKQVKAISNRTPLFEIEQIAKDIIKIENIINKAKEQ